MDDNKLNKYLDHVQEGEQVELQEVSDEAMFFGLMGGIGLFAVAMGALGVWQDNRARAKLPQHPKWAKMIKDYENMYHACKKYFPDSYKKVTGSTG